MCSQKMRVLRSAVVCAAVAAAAGGGRSRSLCFPKAYGPIDNPICLTWQPEADDFVFEIVCKPDSFPELALNWCAVGFSTASSPVLPPPRPGTWGMWPAEVVNLQLLTGGGVVLTDRMTTGVRLPECAPSQATRLLNASVNPSSGVLTAFFARAAVLSEALLKQGYSNLNRTMPFVAAISNQGPQAQGGCGEVFPPHDNEWRNETGKFSLA
jgi:hypothetical protein